MHYVSVQLGARAARKPQGLSLGRLQEPFCCELCARERSWQGKRSVCSEDEGERKEAFSVSPKKLALMHSQKQWGL